MALLPTIRKQLLDIDVALAQPGLSFGYGFLIRRHDGGYSTMKALTASRGKLEALDAAEGVAKDDYPGFSLANAFDAFVADQIPSPDHVVLMRMHANQLVAFKPFSTSFAGQYDFNHDDPHWDEVADHTVRAKGRGELQVFEMEIYSIVRKRRQKILTNLWFGAFKATAQAEAVAMKLRLS